MHTEREEERKVLELYRAQRANMNIYVLIDVGVKCMNPQRYSQPNLLFIFPYKYSQQGTHSETAHTHNYVIM